MNYILSSLKLNNNIFIFLNIISFWKDLIEIILTKINKQVYFEENIILLKTLLLIDFDINNRKFF